MTRPPSVDVDALRVDEDVAQRLLQRAAQLDAQADATSVAQLRQAALEAGVSRQAFDAALAELDLTGPRPGSAAQRAARGRGRGRGGGFVRGHWRVALAGLALLSGGVVAGSRVLEVRVHPWARHPSAPPPGGPAVPAGGPYFESQVEKPVLLLAATPPKYPAALRRDGIGGQVIAQFVVDEAGLPERGTFKVVESTHVLFAASVEDMVPRMRFQPAELGGRRVRQVVQQPFVFNTSR